MGSSENGHRDFQHPRRNARHYNDRLDRFSFISIDLALRALCEEPSLWLSSQSGAGVIVFKANDFADPTASTTLSDISRIASLRRDANNFANVCLGEFAEVPSLSEFLAGRGIPQQGAMLGTIAQGREHAVGYIIQHSVVDGSDYARFAAHIGSIVELIGRVVRVHVGTTKDDVPLAFVNFSSAKLGVALTLWQNALATPGEKPSRAWEGQWISIRGLVRPPHHKQNTPAAHIVVKHLAEIVLLTERVAKYRLGKPEMTPRKVEPSVSNTKRLEEMRSANSARPASVQVVPQPLALAPRVPTPPTRQPLSANQRVLETIRRQAAAAADAAAAAAAAAVAATAAPRPAAPIPAASSRPAPPVSAAPQYAPVPPKAPQRRVPGWVWVVAILVCWALASLMLKG